MANPSRIWGRISGIAVSAAVALAAAPVLAQAERPFTFQRVVNILYGLANFLIRAAMTIAVIMIVYYAILIMTGGGISTVGSGQNVTKVNNAKKGLWYSIIGAAVILGVGVILQTIQNIVDALR